MGGHPVRRERVQLDVWGNRAISDLDWRAVVRRRRCFKVDPFTRSGGQKLGIPLYKWDVSRERNMIGGVSVRQHPQSVSLLPHRSCLGFFRIYSFPWQPKHNAKFCHDRSEAKKQNRWSLATFPGVCRRDEKVRPSTEQGEELLAMVVERPVTPQSLPKTLGSCRFTCRYRWRS